jgi:hypothetical protein
VRENPMIRRCSNKSSRSRSNAAGTGQARDIPQDFYRQKLKEALGAGVEALNDPDIETKVEAYFRDNPTYSRDAVHVAAVACQFKKEKILADKRHRQKTCFQSRPG